MTLTGSTSSYNFSTSGFTAAATAYAALGARNSNGRDQAASGDNFIVSGSGGGGGTAPNAPTSLTAAAGNAQIALSWTASSGATSYNVYRGTSPGGESATAIATGVTSTTYTDTGLTNGTAYYYEVKAVNAYGISGYSNEVNATPVAGGNTVIVQESFSGSNGEALVGTAPDVTNLPGGAWQVDSYNVGGGFNATIDTSQGNSQPSLYMNCAGNSSGAAIISLASGGSYVKPTTLTIQADFNVASMVTGNAPHGAMLGFYASVPSGADPITGFSGLVLQEDGSLVLVVNGTTVTTIVYTGTFVPSHFNTLSYTVNTNTGAISGVTLTGSTSSYNFTSTGFTAAATAYAALGARNSNGRDQAASGDNFIVSGSGGGAAPAAPTSLIATAGNSQVSLSWTASSGATSYNVHRGASTGGESTTPIVTGVTSTTYVNTGLTNGTTYYYEVKAANASGTSGYSNETNAAPTAGTGIVAVKVNDFLSSLGVNIHDDQIGNDSSYTSLFQYTGIRNARAGDGEACRSNLCNPPGRAYCRLHSGSERPTKLSASGAVSPTRPKQYVSAQADLFNLGQCSNDAGERDGPFRFALQHHCPRQL